jgi:filamentous hemagglutinin family protein
MLKKSLLFGLGLIFSSLFPSTPILGQITPDGTLPTEVNTNGNTMEITGGGRAGNNLFHSFSDFNVPNGMEAYFNNADSIQNIINRVTGGNLSNIDGLIRANGAANLILINPAGIIFGPNARIDIGGAFVGSTANSVIFSDGTEFSALDTSVNPILTINVPVGMQWGSLVPPGSITGEAKDPPLPPLLRGEI